jgi:hypothetical protein
MKLLGIISVGVSVTDLTTNEIFLHSLDTGEKNLSAVRQYVSFSWSARKPESL